MLQAALEESAHGIRCPIESYGNLGQGAALPVVQEEGLALGVGDSSQRIGHVDGQLVPHGLLAGRRLLGDQPGPEAVRRGIQFCLQRCLSGDIALLTPLGRIASATFLARIARSHFARAASSLPRNWSRF